MIVLQASVLNGFRYFFILFNTFSPGKIEKSINLDIIGKLIEYSLKKAPVKKMFICTIFEISLFEARSVLTMTRAAGHRHRKD